MSARGGGFGLLVRAGSTGTSAVISATMSVSATATFTPGTSTGLRMGGFTLLLRGMTDLGSTPASGGGGGIYPTPSATVTPGADESRVTTARCDVYLNGAKQAVLTILSGSVSEDENRDTRRTCTVTMVDDTGTLVPQDMTSLLAPKGTELWLYVDDVQVGVFRITKPAIQTQQGGVTVKLDGFDRSRTIARARWENPYQVTVGSEISQAISDLVDNRYPSVFPKLLTQTTYFTPQTLVFGLDSQSNPWKDAVGMATAAGMALYFDVNGVLNLNTVTTDYTNPKALIAEGSGKLISLTRELSEEETYNGVIVSGESPGQPAVRVSVWDTDPLSATYYLGSYGMVPMFYSSPLITDTIQATAAGDELLRRHLGLIESVKVTCLPDPTLRVGDVIQVGHAASKTDGYYVISALTLPLGPGLMQLTCRARTVLS